MNGRQRWRDRPRSGPSGRLIGLERLPMRRVEIPERGGYASSGRTAAELPPPPASVCAAPPADELAAAYHKLYDTYWNKCATLEGDLPGYSLIANGDVNALDEAAEAIEQLLIAKAGSRNRPAE